MTTPRARAVATAAGHQAADGARARTVGQSDIRTFTRAGKRAFTRAIDDDEYAHIHTTNSHIRARACDKKNPIARHTRTHT